MTQSYSFTVPADATKLLVLGPLRELVNAIDLEAEQPRGVYLPKGDSLYWVDDDSNAHYVWRPPLDQDGSVDLTYLKDRSGSSIEVLSVEQERAGGYQGVTPPGYIIDEIQDVAEGLKRDWSDRHASTQHIVKYFEYEHLHNERLREVSRMFSVLADDLIAAIADGPELSAGLRKLLEAKDCCVRAAL